MNDATTSTTRGESAEILIERARSLVPALRQRSKQANADGRLPRETIDDFQRLGLTRCLQPKMFGGFGTSGAGDEVHPDVAWAKLRALVEGARIASRSLWGG